MMLRNTSRCCTIAMRCSNGLSYNVSLGAKTWKSSIFLTAVQYK
jgi:hypothetical protein